MSTPYPIPAMNAIENTPGASVLPDGRIKMDVSRYQKPEQGGCTSIRTGVFYCPELKSPYSKSLHKTYGGSQYISGTLVLHHPYIIKSGAGGNGPEKAFTNLYGKVKLDELHRDIFKVVGCRNKYDMEEQTVETSGFTVEHTSHIITSYKVFEQTVKITDVGRDIR